MFAVLSDFCRSAALRAAAKKYARMLGPRLRRDYGASEHYTPAQIRTAVASCHLPPRHIAIGYAAFMSGELFRSLAIDGDYQSLRRQFFRHVRRGIAQSHEPAPENANAMYLSVHPGHDVSPEG